MKYSNCFIYAVHRWVTRGGWLILRKSQKGPYPHFIHADELPEDLKATHYVAKYKHIVFTPIFRGKVLNIIGNVKPPKVTGKLEWSLLLFWLMYFVGVVSFIYLLIT